MPGWIYLIFVQTLPKILFMDPPDEGDEKSETEASLTGLFRLISSEPSSRLSNNGEQFEERQSLFRKCYTTGRRRT